MSRESVEEKLKELEQFSGLEADLLDLHVRVRNEFSAWREEIESTSDRQQKESLLREYEQYHPARITMHSYHCRMTQRLHKSLLVAKNFARQRAAQMNREELLALTKQRTTKPLSQEDMIGQEVTSSLKRMLETMRTEVDRSAKNIATAKSSSTAITGTASNYRKIDSKLDDTRDLIHDLKRKDRGDKLFVLGAFGVLLATVAFILFQRSPEMVKLPARLAFNQVQEQISALLYKKQNFVEKEPLFVKEPLAEKLREIENTKESDVSSSEPESETVSEQETVNAESVKTVEATKSDEAIFNQPTEEAYASETFTSSAAQSSTTPAVTFAEYESEPLVFNDQQILIEITEPEKAGTTEQDIVSENKDATTEISGKNVSDTKGAITEISGKKVSDIKDAFTESGEAMMNGVDEVIVTQRSLTKEIIEPAVSSNPEPAIIDNTEPVGTDNTELVVNESITQETTDPITESIAQTEKITQKTFEPITEHTAIPEPVETSDPIANVASEPTSTHDQPRALATTDPSEPVESTTVKTADPTSYSTTESDESDVEDLVPNSQLNLDESSYESSREL